MRTNRMPAPVPENKSLTIEGLQTKKVLIGIKAMNMGLF